jgi:signal transduction histidine kinase
MKMNKYWINTNLSTKINLIYGALLSIILLITTIASVLGVWFYFKLGIHDLDELMEILVKVLSMSFISGVILIIILGKFVSRKILEPLNKVIKAEQEISAENLDKRIDYQGNNDEIKILADSFDKMVERLELSFKKQKQFVSDASHELRTPISVISGYASLLERWGKDDKETCDKAITSIKNEAKNMEHLVNKLLLTKTDNNINKTKIDIHNLIDDIIEETKMIDTGRNIYSSSNKKCQIYADISNVKEVIRILVDNAISYTDKNGDIDIYTKKINGKLYINVKDNGIGIPSKDQELIFERFYRVDESRNKVTGGNGLGLAIAKSLVMANGGGIKVESKLGEGSNFIVIFDSV